MATEYRHLSPKLREAVDAQARRLYEVHWIARGTNVEIASFDRISRDAQDGWRELAIWTMNQMAEVRHSALADRNARPVALDTTLSDQALEWLEDDRNIKPSELN